MLISRGSYAQKYYIEPLIFNKISQENIFFINSYFSSSKYYSIKPMLYNAKANLNIGLSVGCYFPKTLTHLRLELSQDNCGATFKYKINEFDSSNNLLETQTFRSVNHITRYSRFGLVAEKEIYCSKNNNSIQAHCALTLGMNLMFSFNPRNWYSYDSATFNTSDEQYIKVKQLNLFSTNRIDLRLVKPSIGIKFSFTNHKTEIGGIQLSYAFNFNNEFYRFVYSNKIVWVSLYDKATNQLLRSDKFSSMHCTGTGFYLTVSKKIFFKKPVEQMQLKQKSRHQF